ncbi:hypothetical protein [Desulfatibacillum aliphaticivorans]|uniref:hypothetical protein n=1 Tax=Desulfatibacillum aliphaticivorans TaxID=218208 RepID=UPI0005C1338E|nr:hypothetical protein [Desulfatibacillum aliphaticivorans]
MPTYGAISHNGKFAVAKFHKNGGFHIYKKLVFKPGKRVHGSTNNAFSSWDKADLEAQRCAIGIYEPIIEKGQYVNMR